MKNRFHLLLIAILAINYSCHQPAKRKPTSNTLSKKVNATPHDTAKKIIIDELDLKHYVDEVNLYLAENDSISAFENYDPRDFRLRKSEVDSLLADETQEEKGKVAGYLLNTYVQAHIDSLLNKVLNHKAIVKYDLSNILNMEITVSPDGKLFSLRYDANTGGTYKNRIATIQYRPGDGTVINDPSDGGEAQNSMEFKSDGFDTIDTLHTKTGVKYLLSGSVIGCTTCIGEYIQLVHLVDGKVNFDFSYSIGRRMYDEDGAITYDSKKKTITVTHNPRGDDENHTECDCNTDDARAILMESNVDPSLRDSVDKSRRLKIGMKLKCVFHFNGNTFLLSSRQSRAPQ